MMATVMERSRWIQGIFGGRTACTSDKLDESLSGVNQKGIPRITVGVEVNLSTWTLKPHHLSLNT